MMTEDRIIGRIKMWHERGYGFAEREGGAHVYVHATALPDGLEHLALNTPISFRLETATDGTVRAADVRINK